MLQGSMDLYAELHARSKVVASQVTRDCAYGPDVRHRLDVFAPPDKGATKRPVLIFVHGGGFVSGDKSRPDTPYYDNIGQWAVAHGFIGVTMTYRLAPQHPWPAGAEDVGFAVEWVARNIAGHGGDPTDIFLMGQSAGAVHVANYLTDARFHRSAGRALAGALLISGVYDLTIADRNQFQKAYYGPDDSKWGQFSSLPGLVTTDLPLLVTVSELDPDDFQRQAAAFVAGRMAHKREYPRLLYLQGHNHLSSVLQIGTDADSLGPEIESFMRHVTHG
jgi:triacylglycerol lipase